MYVINAIVVDRLKMLYYDVFGIKGGGGANRSGLLVCSGSGQCFLECSPAASKFLASMGEGF